MSLSNINWNGKSNSVGQAIANNKPTSPQGAGQSVVVNVPVVASSTGAASPQNFSYQITVNGAGIFPTPVTITPPKSQAEIAKERADAFDRAMGIVG